MKTIPRVGDTFIIHTSNHRYEVLSGDDFLGEFTSYERAYTQALTRRIEKNNIFFVAPDGEYSLISEGESA